MFGICFHYDPKLQTFWDQIIRTFLIQNVYEVGTPEDFTTPLWNTVASVGGVDIKPLICFSPTSAKYMPGLISLEEFEHPKNGLYYFGSDNCHNPKIDNDACVYVPTIRPDPLWSVQAAIIVLYDRWRKHDNN